MACRFATSQLTPLLPAILLLLSGEQTASLRFAHHPTQEPGFVLPIMEALGELSRRANTKDQLNSKVEGGAVQGTPANTLLAAMLPDKVRECLQKSKDHLLVTCKVKVIK